MELFINKANLKTSQNPCCTFFSSKIIYIYSKTK